MNGGFWGIEAVQVTGDMADRMQQHAEAMAQLIAQVVMYVMPGGAVLAYGPIALKRPIGRRTEAGGALTGAHMAKERAYFVHQGTSPLPRRQPIEAFEGILLQQPSPARGVADLQQVRVPPGISTARAIFLVQDLAHNG